MDNSNALKKFIVCIFILLSLMAGIVVFFDPFYHFHKPLPFLKTVLEDRDFQVGGTIDHFDYDALVVGTSIIENANLDEINGLFNCNAIKVVRASGRTSDLCYYVDRAFSTYNSVDTVIYAMTFEELMSDLDIQVLNSDFSYLMDRNPFNDVKYLLNKDVLLKKIPMQIAYSFIYEYDEAEPYCWYKSKSFSEEACMSSYAPRERFEVMLPNDYFDESLSGNLVMMEEMVKNHTQTRFYLYMSPYSALWWDEAYRSGQMDAYMSVLEQVYASLDKYDNVVLFTYILDEDITFDFNSYMDTLHFSPEWNSRIFNRMASFEGVYSEASFAEKEKAFYETIKHFSESGIKQYYENATVKTVE